MSDYKMLKMSKEDLESLEQDDIDRYFKSDVPDSVALIDGSTLNFVFRDSVDKGKGKMSMMKNLAGPLEPPDYPKEIPEKALNKDVLVDVPSEKFCKSPLLRGKVMRRYITCIRGLVKHSGINMNVFSTKELVKLNPKQEIETREQILTAVDQDSQSWVYASEKGTTTLEAYAAYQQKFKDPSQRKGFKIIFGTNLDLSDKDLFKEQLEELKKLPYWAQVECPLKNLLNYTQMNILGMNTLQVYLKVTGSRTPAHQENNNFCSVNINIGPGITEWFAVSQEYWGYIAGICKKKGLDFLKDSWWPDAGTLEEYGIPYERFDQLPGDLVFVNIGCVHWVQAKGTCNNVAWNVGPITSKQFEAAIERYEWNRISDFRSIVPMQHLSWELAKKLKTSKTKLYESIKITLAKSLIQVIRMMHLVQEQFKKEDEDKKGPKPEDSRGRYCHGCTEEIFAVFFISPHRKVNGMLKMFCFDCAKRDDPTHQVYKCVEEYTLEQLIIWYDGFQLVEKKKRPLDDDNTP